MVVVVFKVVPRADIPTEEFQATAARMAELVVQVPGFSGMDFTRTDDGEVLIARFQSHEALATWRNHPDHLEAQRLGRERYFAHYSVEVCEKVRSYEFP